MLVFVLTKSFPFTTGLNEAKESMNKDLDFNEKNKWKFIKSQRVRLCFSPEGEGGGGVGEGSIPLHQVIEIFFQQSSTVLLTRLLFSTLILPVVIYKN